MATIKRFENVECWQEAREFVKFIYELTKRDEFRKDQRLVTQVRGSAVSSMANTCPVKLLEVKCFIMRMFFKA